jgi:rhomboid family GlyGly-CTERM serine protease
VIFHVAGSRRSWLLLAAAAIAGSLIPAERLELRRNFELWRIVTCHFTHFSHEQLAWDAIAFAFLGFACARRNGAAFHATLLASIVVVPIAVLLFAPHVASYRGLSGLASAMFALLLTLERRRLTWPVVLCAIGFAGKIALEATTGGTLFVGSMGESVVSVPIAHIAGAVVGVICGVVASGSGGRRLWTAVASRDRSTLYSSAMRFALVILLALMPLTAHAATRAETDARAVNVYRTGLSNAATQMNQLSLGDRKILNAEEKESARRTWSAFLDYLIALDSIGAYHRDGHDKASTQVTYAAFLAQYRGALEMIDAAEKLPGANEVLNEPVPSLGVPAGSYAKIKLRWLNVLRATEFGALQSLYLMHGGGNAAIDADAKFILAKGRGRGQELTARNAMKIAGSTAFTAWFPVQKGVAEWMGDTRVARAHTFLVTDAQIAELAPKLEPGDVMLERREWYVSNIGLPGYWPHTALFIGSAADRVRYFDDPVVREWVRSQGRADGEFEAFLRERYPQAYAQSQAGRVIEAMSEGVLFTTLQHSAAADSLAILRPRATRREKAIAIARAFGYVGRPYDFDFDFHTDATLVCSEVVYKAYEGAVTLPLSTTAGRLNTPPNEIVREFDETYDTPRQQFDFVLFLDGHERAQRAVTADVATLRSSWKRPKWHIVTN